MTAGSKRRLGSHTPTSLIILGLAGSLVKAARRELDFTDVPQKPVGGIKEALSILI